MNTTEAFDTSGVETIVEPSGTDSQRDPGRKRRGRAPKWLVMTLVFLGTLVLGLVLLIGLGGLLFGVRTDVSPLERTALPAVEGAPDADYVMVVTERGTSGPSVDRELVDQVGGPMTDDRRIQAGSAELVADIQSVFGVSKIFRWVETPEAVDANNPAMSCNGVYGPLGGSSTCGDDPTNEGEPLLGSGRSTTNDETSYNVEIYGGLPDTAVWVVVDTESGLRIAAAVADGATFLQWPSDGPIAARPTKVTALNASMEPVWSSPLESAD